MMVSEKIAIYAELLSEELVCSCDFVAERVVADAPALGALRIVTCDNFIPIVSFSGNIAPLLVKQQYSR